MTYPDNFEQKSGFDRIRLQVEELCTTQGGRRMLAEELFTDSFEEVERRLRACDELRTALMMEGDFPKEEFCDLEPIARRVEIAGTFLEIEELIELRRGLQSVNEVVRFFNARSDEQYPVLKRISEGVDAFPAIINHIDSLIDRFGKVKDSASPELYSLRRTIREREGQVAKRLQAVLTQARNAGYVDADATVSVRDGRSVIPVPAVNKRKISGFVHDESATGKTFYIEPVEVVEINNELKELEYAERREIVRILTVFTESIRPDSEGIARAGRYLAEIDKIRAKARWALKNDCVKPILSDDGRLNLRSACHPLLKQTLAKEGREVVPLDLTLDPEHRILVISGPNAGGKSVCLKTVGLLQYMLQCGFLVPCGENSEFPMFDTLFIDIGDEQSIDNDLSTYSSHLLNMKRMLAGAGSRSLVLIDEFGSGTEPIIGGAIAESILERFVEHGVYGVITTHYSNVKYFASNHAGIVNGAMMFDVQNIRPMFRLEMGRPGSSFAVEIARKIGLPEEIIRSASEKAGTDHINLERQLREIARDRRYWEQKRDRIRIADRKVEELEQNYGEQLAAIKQERTRIIQEAKAEADRLLAEANRRIENTIRTIRESQAEKEKTRLVRHELEEFRGEVEQRAVQDVVREERIDREMERVAERQRKRAERKLKSGGKGTVQEAEPERPVLAVGVKVRIIGQDGVGEVIAMKGKKATVAIGQILTSVACDRLEPISNSEYKRQTRPVAPRTVVSVDIAARKLNFKRQVDVRGMRVVEALECVRDFIDDALMMGADEVRILHGKGTGALKEEIRRYLRGVSEIAEIADEHVDLGGAGITVVRFH